MLTPSGGWAWRLDTALPAACPAMLDAVARLMVGRCTALTPMNSEAATARTRSTIPTLAAVIARRNRRIRGNRGGRGVGDDPFWGSRRTSGAAGRTGVHVAPGPGIV